MWQYAWKVTEQLMVAMDGEVKGHGAQFLVVTASVGPQVYPDPVWRAKFAESIHVKDLFYPDLRIRQLGRHAGFPVLDLASTLQTYADEHHEFLHGFSNTKLGTGHWNETGHRLAGERIAGRLCGLIRSPDSGEPR